MTEVEEERLDTAVKMLEEAVVLNFIDTKVALDDIVGIVEEAIEVLKEIS